jgi:hypothetical protein
VAFEEDLLAFLKTSDFAVTATYDGSASVVGIFDNAHELASLGLAMQAAARPQFLCRASDVDPDPVGKRITVNDTDYRVAEHQPDGTGFTLLILKLSP